MKKAEAALTEGDGEACKELSGTVEDILQKTQELAAFWLKLALAHAQHLEHQLSQPMSFGQMRRLLYPYFSISFRS